MPDKLKDFTSVALGHQNGSASFGGSTKQQRQIFEFFVCHANIIAQVMDQIPGDLAKNREAHRCEPLLRRCVKCLPGAFKFSYEEIITKSGRRKSGKDRSEERRVGK